MRICWFSFFFFFFESSLSNNDLDQLKPFDISCSQVTSLYVDSPKR